MNEEEVGDIRIIGSLTTNIQGHSGVIIIIMYNITWNQERTNVS